MNQPRSGDGARRLGVEGCHTRAAFHGPSHCGWGVALEVQGGWSKVRRQDLVHDHCPSHRRVFFLFPAFSRGGADRWAEWGQLPSWGFRPPKRCATSLRLPCQPDPGAIACRVCDHGPGLIFGGLISHFPNGIREAMIYKGTMGTWEQAMSNRQKAELLEGVSLFPSYRAALGTWEQKWPIPMQENPRACGDPVPPPAVERR